MSCEIWGDGSIRISTNTYDCRGALPFYIQSWEAQAPLQMYYHNGLEALFVTLSSPLIVLLCVRHKFA